MTLIAIHMLQNHAPSNLNRDDNGDPKDALFGGVRRARISSQSLKRSIRWSDTFRSYFTDMPALLAERTQLLPALVRAAARLGKGDSRPVADAGDESAEDGKKARRGKKGDIEIAAAQRVKNAQLIFLTSREMDQLAERRS